MQHNGGGRGLVFQIGSLKEPWVGLIRSRRSPMISGIAEPKQTGDGLPADDILRAA